MRPEGKQGTDRYDDILYHSYQGSETHPRMSMIDRAAQFSPFAALTGYHEAVEETGRITEKRIELDESEKRLLDQTLSYLLTHVSEQRIVRVRYFLPDRKKEGGSYQEKTGIIVKADRYRNTMTFLDGSTLKLTDIMAISMEN